MVVLAFGISLEQEAVAPPSVAAVGVLSRPLRY